MAFLEKTAPTAEHLFQEIISDQDTSAKLKQTLILSKKACDHIIKANGKLTKKAISNIGTELYGGPAYSTIANKHAKAKPYIDLRIKEQATIHPQKKPLNHDKATVSAIDISSLDPVNRRKVHDLQQQCSLYIGIIEDLKQRVLTQTRGHPQNIAKAISLGPNVENGSLQIIQVDDSKSSLSRASLGEMTCPKSALDILRRLLLITDPNDPLKTHATVSWKEYRDQIYLQAETVSGYVTLATEEEISAVAKWIGLN